MTIKRLATLVGYNVSYAALAVDVARKSDSDIIIYDLLGQEFTVITELTYDALLLVSVDPELTEIVVAANVFLGLECRQRIVDCAPGQAVYVMDLLEKLHSQRTEAVELLNNDLAHVVR